MKFLYFVLPFLYPQFALACIASGFSTVEIVVWVITTVTFISLVITCVLLIVMRLLPRNKGLTLSAVISKAKIQMVFIAAITLYMIIGTIAVFIYNDITTNTNDSYTDPNGMTWHKAC
jgi:preprotein translocase subunit SecG